MTPVLGLLLILLIVFVGARFFGRSAILYNPLASGIIVSGIPYILMGVLLGPRFFNFLSTDIISSLQPLISLALGWIGLLFGIQLYWRKLRCFQANHLAFASLQSMVSFLAIFSAMGFFIYFFSPEIFKNRWEAIIILAALGSSSSPLTIARIVIYNKAQGRLTDFVRFISGLDSFWGITIAGLAFAIFHPPAARWFTASWQWVLLSIVISAGIGLIFHCLIQMRFQAKELFLLVLGLVIFTSGIGFYLQLSPIFMTMVVGITLAQFHWEAGKVMRVLSLAEKPTYLFLLIFAGALWNYRLWEEIFLILLFILSRYVGKYIGGWISARKINCGFPIPANVGKTLLSFGGVSLAIAFNFQLFYGGCMGDFVMSATILGIFVFDEYTAVSALNILRRQGEIP